MPVLGAPLSARVGKVQNRILSNFKYMKIYPKGTTTENLRKIYELVLAGN